MLGTDTTFSSSVALELTFDPNSSAPAEPAARSSLAWPKKAEQAGARSVPAIALVFQPASPQRRFASRNTRDGACPGRTLNASPYCFDYIRSFYCHRPTMI